MWLRTITPSIPRKLHQKQARHQHRQNQYHAANSDPVRTSQKRRDHCYSQSDSRSSRTVLDDRQSRKTSCRSDQTPAPKQCHADTHTSRQSRAPLETHEYWQPMTHNRENCRHRQQHLRATDNHRRHHRNSTLGDVQPKHYRAVFPTHLSENIGCARITRPHLENIHPRKLRNKHRERQRTKQIRHNRRRYNSDDFVFNQVMLSARWIFGRRSGISIGRYCRDNLVATNTSCT